MRTLTPGKERAFSLNTVPVMRKLGISFCDREEEELEDRELVDVGGAGASCANNEAQLRTAQSACTMGFIQLRWLRGGSRLFR